jgi:hypothetical protein
MECENANECHFYANEIPVDKGLGELQKEKYCEGDKTLCAIYKVASIIGTENVPSDLCPNMVCRANKAIEEYYRNTMQKM